MDEFALAQILLRFAREDNFDDIGRIIVSDAAYNVRDKTLTAEKIKELFGKFYPTYDVEIRTDNIVLVFWSGKDTVKNVRGLRPPVNVDTQPEEKEVKDDGEKVVKGEGDEE